MKTETPESVELLGGTLALDFVNTVDWDDDGAHAAPERSDVLTDADTLRRWGRRIGVLGPRCRLAGTDELARVRALRDLLYRMFSAVAGHSTPHRSDVAEMSAQVAEATASGRLVRAGEAWAWEWPRDDPRRIRYAVVLDALRLLEDPDLLARISRCPGRQCGWLFLDRSGRRRWCSMQTCGARDKMRRMYEQRKRSARTTSA